MKWLIATLFCFNVYAATDFEDGSLLLTPQEVSDTRTLLSEMRWRLQEQQMKMMELQKQVDFYKTSRCL